MASIGNHSKTTSILPHSKHPPPAQRGEGWQVRHTQVLLLVLCSAINYADRVNISIAIVDMASSHNWGLGTQALVMSSFFWGYICSQVVAALMAQRYGGKLIMGTVSVQTWAVQTAEHPSLQHQHTPPRSCLHHQQLRCAIAGGPRLERADRPDPCSGQGGHGPADHLPGAARGLRGLLDPGKTVHLPCVSTAFEAK